MKTRSLARHMFFSVALITMFFVVASTSQAVKEKEAAKAPVSEKQPAAVKQSRPAENSFAVARPPFSEGIFPCSQCHAYMKANTKRRNLTEYHGNIVLNHAQGQRWCTDCHDSQNRDKLKLASGDQIEFSESYKLCGQCHGTQFRDWKVGVHGKRTGNWNGDKQYLLCVNCHNPHDPKFKVLKPLPPPDKPGSANH